MIDKTALTEFVESELAETPYFLVDVDVSPANEIKIEIDSLDGVDLDYCMDLSKRIEDQFPREPEDYELEVGSAGLTSPFKVLGQFEKNIGNEVEVMACDGKKYTGILREADENGFTITMSVKEKPEGSKRPVIVERDKTFAHGDVNSVKYLLRF